MPRALQTVTAILLIGNLIGTLFVGVFVGWSLVTFFTNIGDKPENIPVGGIGTSRVGNCNIPTPTDPVTNQPIPIAAYIGQASEFYKLPAAYIAAVIEQESAFNPTARSPVGASGFMQLMPSTFEGLQAGGLEYLKTLLYGKGRSYPFANKNLRETYEDHFEDDGTPATRPLSGTSEDITNPKYNIFLGTSYLRQQYDTFSRGSDGQPKGAHGRHTGDELLSIMAAAYNAGPGAVQRYNGIPPYAETQKYVTRIMTELYPKYQACEEEIESAPSAPSDKADAIVQAAKERIGDPSICKFGAPANVACTSLVKDVLDPIAGTNYDLNVPRSWSQSEGQKISDSSQAQPGDIVYWYSQSAFANQSEVSSDFALGDRIPTHVGIYIGNYSGDDGRGNQVSYSQAVVHNSSSLATIVVDPINTYPIHGFKRY